MPISETESLRVLIESAKKKQLCEMYYRKAVSRESVQPRLIEPYSLVTGKQDTLVRCFQTDPDPGWRTFMLHKIDSLSITDSTYKPRRKATIIDAEVHIQYEPSSYWTDERKVYRDLICDILADGRVDSRELKLVQEHITSKPLMIDDIRFVHANLYHRALGAIIQDGFMSDLEVAETRFLHKVFSALGWSIGE